MKGIATGFAAIALLALAFSPANSAGTATNISLYGDIEEERQDTLRYSSVGSTVALRGPIADERQRTLLVE